MSDSPIVVIGGQSLPDSIIKGTTKSPLVVPKQSTNNSLLNNTFNLSQSIYKVRMIANGKTFNMLLPPSVESKHPGRSNALQLPGLEIKAGVAISKLKIPGFFPIYQHLGVESLTVSMSGMFTGYDGTDLLSTASNWETDFKSNEGQDAAAAISEFYNFAVNNKAVVEVNIYTSDGSFTPKKGAATTFRDDQSNIKFKGYVKEFTGLYVRQDRAYYMLRFEILDLGTNICKSVKEKDTKKVNNLLNDAAIGIGNKTTNKAISKAAVGIGDPNYINDQFNSLSDLDREKIISDLITSKILKTDYNSNDLSQALSYISNTYGTQDINKIKTLLDFSSSNSKLNNLEGDNIFSTSFKNIQEGLKTIPNTFNSIKNVSDSFLNRTVSELKESTDNLIFEARSANLISVARGEQLKTLNEIAATKNEKNILDFINKSVSNIKTYSNNSINNDIAKQLIDQEISDTINKVVVHPLIKEGLTALNNNSTFDITRNTKLNDLLNLGNINKSNFEGIPEQIQPQRYETVYERIVRKNTNLFPNALINTDRLQQGINPVRNTDSILYVGTTQDGRSLIYDVSRDGQYFGTYAYNNQQLIKVSPSIKNELPIPLPNEGRDYFDPKTGASFNNELDNTPRDFSNINDFKQINTQNNLKATDVYYEVGRRGLNRIYSVTRNGIQLGIYEVGIDAKDFKRTITKL